MTGSAQATPRILGVAELGVMPYGEALALQRTLALRRIEGSLAHDLLLIVEHPPVVTLGRSSKAAHVLLSSEALATRGIELFEVERGGDVTFHGPGQLVGYPIMDLRNHRQDLHWYLRRLEASLIAALASLGIESEAPKGLTGVWTRGRKVASIGVHAKQWVTWHGFALNVTTDLSYFDAIVACGIPGVEMTSVARELAAPSGPDDLSRRVTSAVVTAFAGTFGMTSEAIDILPG